MNTYYIVSITLGSIGLLFSAGAFFAAFSVKRSMAKQLDKRQFAQRKTEILNKLEAIRDKLIVPNTELDTATLIELHELVLELNAYDIWDATIKRVLRYFSDAVINYVTVKGEDVCERAAQGTKKTRTKSQKTKAIPSDYDIALHLNAIISFLKKESSVQQ
ncbi:MAG: hypothetical protein FWB76_04725 [Oscillospiraceae bacterium]|nr:hypothetical protein [Oscillospiraceae bacterium]